MTSESAIDQLGGWPTLLGKLTTGQDLSADEAKAALDTILEGAATDSQISAFIVGLRAKGESVEELVGLVEGMFTAATPLDVPPEAIDIVGAGGAPSRRAHALNISTMACFVAVGAGAVVCKHGNRKASSTSGSFDLLEQLGVNIDVSAEQLERSVREVGLGFAFARAFHPSMRHVGHVRAEVGIPTVFNILGPLANPGRLQRQVIGVADHALAGRMIAVQQARGAVHSMVVTGDGPLDELTTTGPSTVHELRDGEIKVYEFDAQSVGIDPAGPDDLIGGDAEVNAAIARRLFAGETGPVRDIVVLNAAAGLVVAGVADTMADGVAAAASSLDDGAAQRTLDQLVAFA